MFMLCRGVGRRGSNRERPAPGHLGSITLQGCAVAEKEDAHIETAIAQVPRRREAVAAVIAGAAEDADAGARAGQFGGQLHRRIGDGPAGVLHQVEARVAGYHGQAVGFGHLRRRQQFIHVVVPMYAPRTFCSKRCAKICRERPRFTEPRGAALNSSRQHFF